MTTNSWFVFTFIMVTWVEVTFGNGGESLGWLHGPWLPLAAIVLFLVYHFKAKRVKKAEEEAAARKAKKAKEEEAAKKPEKPKDAKKPKDPKSA